MCRLKPGIIKNHKNINTDIKLQLLRVYLGPYRFKGKNTDIKYIVEKIGRIQSWQFSITKSQHISRGILSQLHGNLTTVGRNINPQLPVSLALCISVCSYLGCVLLEKFLSACLSKKDWWVSESCSTSTAALQNILQVLEYLTGNEWQHP